MAQHNSSIFSVSGDSRYSWHPPLMLTPPACSASRRSDISTYRYECSERNPLPIINYKITVHISSRSVTQTHCQLTDAYCVRQHQRNSLRDPSASVESESVIHHHKMTSIATALFSSVEIQPSNISVIQQQQHSQHISASTYQPQRPFASNHREYYPGYSQPVRASTQNTAHPLLQSISHS